MRGSTASRPLILLGLGVSMALGTSMNVDAEAAQVLQRTPITAPIGDDNHIANGRHNLSNITIRSPTRIHGIQHVADSNVLSKLIHNNAICKKKHFCKIHQRAVIINH